MKTNKKAWRMGYHMASDWLASQSWISQLNELGNNLLLLLNYPVWVIFSQEPKLTKTKTQTHLWFLCSDPEAQTAAIFSALLPGSMLESTNGGQRRKLNDGEKVYSCLCFCELPGFQNLVSIMSARMYFIFFTNTKEAFFPAGNTESRWTASWTSGHSEGQTAQIYCLECPIPISPKPGHGDSEKQGVTNSYLSRGPLLSMSLPRLEQNSSRGGRDRS